MISNLFSIFDTRTNNLLELNWISSILNIFLIPLIYWILKSRIIKLLNLIIILLYYEFKIILNRKFNYINSIIFIRIFIIILLNNFIGLYPYIFTSSRHLIFSLTLSLPLWIGLIIFGWINNSNFIFRHIIPQGTPNILIPFIVLIERISNIIRPWTLSIRLTANIIAGHLLLTLLRESAITPFKIIIILIIIIQIILLILEFRVSIIQSYVLTILRTLYSKETNYE